ncbi:unnamed protein product [Orchesella dallaii]|uniref:Uncharacterized protein n=1 Tax=Orchesella dallaii TaxID=48710 RepID=A0ABP1PL37_9HEXA
MIQSFYKYFDKAWTLVKDKPDFIGMYSVYPDRNIFKEIHVWRVEYGKLKNRSIQFYLSNLDVLKLAIMKPKNVNDLSDCVIKARELDNDTKLSLLCIIARLTEVNHIWIVKEIPQTKNTQNEPVAPADIMEVAVTEFDCDNDSVFDKNIVLENDVVIENDIVELVELDTVETKAGQNVDCIKNESSNPFHVVAFDKNDGKRYTMHDFINGRVKTNPLKNFFKKKMKNLNRICTNDHLIRQGLKPMKFRINRGVKAREKAAIYCKKFRGNRRN